MALRIVATAEEQLAGGHVRELVAEALGRGGTALVLVPSFDLALEVSRALADAGFALGVSVTTPAAWVRERWEAWGDGRALVDGITLSLLAHEVLSELDADADSPLSLSPGLVGLLTSLVAHAGPWLPIGGDGEADRAACAAAGLTQAETALVDAAGRLTTLLARRGRICGAAASQVLPALLEHQGVALPETLFVGWSAMCRQEVELARALAARGVATFVARVRKGPAGDELASLVRRLGGEPADLADAPKGEPIAREEGLEELRAALFGGGRIDARKPGPVELLLASGPVAEAELVARRVMAVGEGQGDSGHGQGMRLAIAVPDATRARRELFEKLAARGASVRIQDSRALLDCPTAAAFLAFAETVAELAELAATWPEPEEGIDGPVPRLGSMAWWPPSAIIDFMLLEASGVAPAKAWALDARWRGNRLLTPRQVLDALQSEREGSPQLARATTELLHGHVGTAASRLLGPLMGGAEGHEADGQDVPGEAVASLQAIMRVAVALREYAREQGRDAGADVDATFDLAGIVRLCRWACEGMSVGFRDEAVGEAHAPQVRILSHGEAATLAPGSVDTLVVCGLTTVEAPIGRADDLESALLAELGVEPAAEPMAHARARFHALVSVPARHLVLERVLHDGDAKPAYPSVMLSELLSAYGASPLAEPGELPIPVTTGVETELGANLARLAPPVAELSDEPHAEGAITEAARPYVLVPQEGSLGLPDGKPVLSASQVETYLDCPYKWFSLRRLRLGTVDAGHGGAEMGTFAHRVLEVTHRELLVRALEAACPGVGRDELLADIGRDPARAVKGSRVTDETLEDALALLEGELELHSQHMRMVRKPRPAQQVLVAHSLAEEAQEERLKADLRSLMPYQTGLLAGFEPRLFEWGFGRHDELVEYAGAYFTGTVDRIDVSASGDAVIIDYKHKSPSGFAGEYDAIQEGVLEGTSMLRRVQSLIYAQVVRRAFGERLRLVGTVYLATKAPHALAGAADAAYAERIFGPLSSRRAPRVSVPRRDDGSLGMYELLDRTEELVAQEVARMLAGEVEARPRDKESCRFCPVMHCERRVVR